MSKVIQINRSVASTSRILVPRARLDTAPFTAQQRDEVLVRFHYLKQSIAQIAAHFGTGYGPVQEVLRFGFFRVVGRRRSDRITKEAA